MKKIVCKYLILFLLCTTLEARMDANFKVPGYVYTLDNIDEAIRIAKQENRPISYLYANPKSSCGLHNRDAELSLKESNQFSVVVLVDTRRNKETYDKISPLVLTALKSKEMGNIIPRMVTASDDGTQVFAAMRNDQMDQRSAFSQHRKKVLSEESLEINGTDLNPPLQWFLKGKKGRHYYATFLGLNGSKLELKRVDNGLEFEMDINKFTPAVAAYARELNTRIKANIVYPMEHWTNVDGREIEGQFVKLDGSEITLKLKNGQKVTFKTELLSAPSLERARELSSN